MERNQYRPWLEQKKQPVEGDVVRVIKLNQFFTWFVTVSTPIFTAALLPLLLLFQMCISMAAATPFLTHMPPPMFFFLPEIGVTLELGRLCSGKVADPDSVCPRLLVNLSRGSSMCVYRAGPKVPKIKCLAELNAYRPMALHTT